VDTSLKIAFLAVIGLLPTISNATDIQDILTISKMTGACGVMQQMVAFQASTNMKGGDEFIDRFWRTELARIGKTQEAFLKECEGSIAAYERIWNLDTPASSVK